MEKIKSPFVYDSGVNQYTAKFPLPDDGTPDTEQWLEVTIGADPDDGLMSCHTYACSRSGKLPVRRFEIASSYSVPMDGVVRALYGVARKRTIEVIEPIL